MNDPSNLSGPRIRVFIVSGHPVMLLGWAAMLSRAGGFAIVGETSRGSAALDAIAAAASGIDLVLVDTELPDMAGTELVRILLPLHPPLRFALLAERNGAPLPGDTMALAPRIGQIHYATSAGELGRVLRSLRVESERSASEDDTATTLRPGADHNLGPGNKLTQRERELLALMGLGLSNQQIAERLRIAMPTVKFHVTHILSKMGADNRTEAVLLGLRHGLVQLQ
ncbi:MAG: response regulator transcription factor [Pseudomonadota bacterium]|nr:response regulator transcription factor [Pseudomonadota bacterium]